MDGSWRARCVDHHVGGPRAAAGETPGSARVLAPFPLEVPTREHALGIRMTVGSTLESALGRDRSLAVEPQALLASPAWAALVAAPDDRGADLGPALDLLRSLRG